MTVCLSNLTRRTRSARRSAAVWCGLALAGLVVATEASAQVAPVQPPPTNLGGPAADDPLPPLPPESNEPPAAQPPPAPEAAGRIIRGEPLPPPPVLVMQPPGAGHAPLDDDRIQEAVETPRAEIHVVVGRSKFVRAKQSFSRIVIANPAIADVQLLDADQPDPRLLNLYGRSFGTTTLTLFAADQAFTYLVRVTIDTADLEKRLGQVFPGAEVQVRQIGSQVILEGQVPDAKTMAEVVQLVTAELLGNATLALTPSAGAVVPSAGQAAPDGVAPPDGAAPDPGQEPTPLGGVAGSGPAPTPANFPAAPATGLAAGTIINRLHVPGPRQVLLKVKIAELNRTAIRQLGVNFQRRTSGDTITSAIGNLTPAQSQLIGIFDEGNFSLFINALRQNDLAKILAEPNLMTLDGQPARFLAGGSFPYPIPQTSSGGGTAITIAFRDFGTILQFIPHIMANDLIRLDVEPAFSRLDFATGTSVLGTTVPGVNRRSARTVVELREGQTLALAGLLQTTTNASTARIPILGDIPIVGPWFSRNSIATVETELVVLVTPELVTPMEKNEVPPSPGDRVLEPNDYEFYFLGRLEGKTGHPHRATVHYLDPLEIMKHHRSEDHWVIGPHGHAD